MGKFVTFIALTALTSAMGTTALAAAPDVYVVNFKNEKNADSQTLDSQIYTAISMSGTNAEHVIFDTTTAARWEKGAHEAFDRNIVPVFNKWVGLPGFAAIVDAKSKRVLGCVNPKFDASEMAQEIKKMSAQISGKAYMSNTAFSSKTTQCPAAFNTPPK